MKTQTQHIGYQEKERDFFYGRNSGNNNKPVFQNDKFDSEIEVKENSRYEDDEYENERGIRGKYDNHYDNDLDFDFEEEL